MVRILPLTVETISHWISIKSSFWILACSFDFSACANNRVQSWRIIIDSGVFRVSSMSYKLAFKYFCFWCVDKWFQFFIDKSNLVWVLGFKFIFEDSIKPVFHFFWANFFSEIQDMFCVLPLELLRFCECIASDMFCEKKKCFIYIRVSVFLFFFYFIFIYRIESLLSYTFRYIIIFIIIIILIVFFISCCCSFVVRLLFVCYLACCMTPSYSMLEWYTRLLHSVLSLRFFLISL
jgi:hypothetical protein